MTIAPSIGGPVPRFFFDTNDGNQSIFDKAGLELEGLEAANLVDMVRDALPADDPQAFIVSVMDEAGQLLVRTTLSLVSEYPAKAPE
jgi:hypothetical protein